MWLPKKEFHLLYLFSSISSTFSTLLEIAVTTMRYGHVLRTWPICPHLKQVIFWAEDRDDGANGLGWELVMKASSELEKVLKLIFYYFYAFEVCPPSRKHSGTSSQFIAYAKYLILDLLSQFSPVLGCRGLLGLKQSSPSSQLKKLLCINIHLVFSLLKLMEWMEHPIVVNRKKIILQKILHLSPSGDLLSLVLISILLAHTHVDCFL